MNSGWPTKGIFPTYRPWAFLCWASVCPGPFALARLHFIAEVYWVFVCLRSNLGRATDYFACATRESIGSARWDLPWVIEPLVPWLLAMVYFLSSLLFALTHAHCSLVHWLTHLLMQTQLLAHSSTQSITTAILRCKGLGSANDGNAGGVIRTRNLQRRAPGRSVSHGLTPPFFACNCAPVNRVAVDPRERIFVCDTLSILVFGSSLYYRLKTEENISYDPTSWYAFLDSCAGNVSQVARP